MKIESVKVLMLVRVSDDATDKQIENIRDVIYSRENESEEGDTELLLDAATEHMAEVEEELGKALQFADYAVSRDIAVKRKGEK